VGHYVVDPERSDITASVRPDMGLGPLPVRMTGEVDLDDDDRAAGHLAVIIGDDGGAMATVDLTEATVRVERDDGVVVLHGTATRPANTFGLGGPPLLNPIVVLRWRARLVAHED